MKKVVFIFARLIDEPEAYRNKRNADIEEEILKEIGSFPYLAKIKKVTVLDSEKVEIEESENPYKELRGHGLSKKVARNIVRFYES